VTPRRTHDYPDGKPLPIVLVEIAFGIVGLFWIVAPISWWRVVLFGLVFIAFVSVRSELLDRYEHSGRAVRRPTHKKIVFLSGMPAPLLVLRYVFFIPVITMFAFGIAPLAVARVGIISCILSLVVLAFVYTGLQAVYVNSGRAQEVIDTPDSPFKKSPSSTP
jgi:hypothetical protein